MDMEGALGLEFTNPFDLHGFTFDAENLPSASSDMSSMFSPLECPTLSDQSLMGGSGIEQ